MAEGAARELKIEGGPTTTIVPTTTTGSKSATLTFAKPDEIAIYEELVNAAEEKDYSLSKYIVRLLTGKEPFPLLSEK